MTHARRVKPKQRSTKEKLESTVIRSRANSSLDTRMQQATNAGQVSSSKAEAFDKAFGNSRGLQFPFFGKRKEVTSSRSRNTVSGKTDKSGRTVGQKFMKRIILLAIFCLLAFALLSLSFRTKTLSIQGNSQLNTDQVQQLSKIYTGTPLLWVTERNVKDLLRNPWVDKVKINRVFPNTVTIDLIERVPVAAFSSNLSTSIMGDNVMAAENLQLDGINVENQVIAYAADGMMLPNVSADVLSQLTLIDGWGEDRAIEGLELLNFLNRTPEFSVTEINYTPEGFEASFNYGLQESASSETSFIMGQLQTPSLTLLKDHWSGFVHALSTREGATREGSGTFSAASGESNMADLSEGMFIVSAPQLGVGQNLAGHGLAGENLDQETRRIVKRKYITVYGWGVSLSE